MFVHFVCKGPVLEGKVQKILIVRVKQCGTEGEWECEKDIKKSGDPCNPGWRKFLQIVENLNKMRTIDCRKAFQRSQNELTK